MTDFWNEMLEDSEHVSNVRIVCVDGVIISHKIIVASVSNFIKDIITDIPTNDEVTIFLPDFHKDEVEKYLSVLKSAKREEDIFADQIKCLKFKTVSDNNLKEEENLNIQLDFLKEEDEFNTNEYFKPESLDTEDAEEEGTSDIEDESPKKKTKGDLRNFCLNVAAVTGQNDYLSGDCGQVVRDIKENLVKNPKSLKDKAKNKKLLKKIAYEKAKSYYLSGQCDSVRKAAKLFNVDHTSLGKFLRTGELYEGRGNKGKYFSGEDEKNIVNRALQIVKSGQNFDSTVLKNLIEEEFEVVKVNLPERSSKVDDLIKNPSRFQQFCTYFTKKYDLNRHFPERIGNYECEVCYKRFTFKNSMVSHRKTVHSFLF